MSSVVGPHTVCMCALIHEYAQPQSDYLPSFSRQNLAAFLLHESKSADSYIEPTLEGFAQRVRDALQSGGDYLVGAVKNRIGAFACPDDLLSFFADLKDLLSAHPGDQADLTGDLLRIDPTSALGVYLRSALLTVNRLPFEGACRLHSQVAAYLRAADNHAPKLPGHNELHAPQLRPHRSLEAFLHRQADMLDKGTGGDPMEATEARLAELARLSPGTPRVHYLQHLNYLQHHDYPAALDSLHRYFDYTAGLQAGLSTPSAAASAQAGRFQSALLSLGAAHSHFGHVEEALLALRETVRTSHQHNDDVCLAHALAALCRLLASVSAGPRTSGRATAGANGAGGLGGGLGTMAGAVAAAQGVTLGGGGGGGAGAGPAMGGQGPQSEAASTHQQLVLLLRHCLHMAQELRMPHIAAFARLALAQHDTQHAAPGGPAGARDGAGGGGRAPAAASAVDRAVREAQRLQHAAACAAASPQAPAPAAPAGVAGAPPPPAAAAAAGVDLFTTPDGVAAGGVSAAAAGAMAQLAGGAHLLRGAAWTLMGSAPLASTSALIPLVCYGDALSADNSAVAICQVAAAVAARRGPAAAQAVLDMVASRAPIAGSRELRAGALRLTHARALAHGDAPGARAAAGAMAAVAARVAGHDLGARVEAECARVECALDAGDLEGAETALHAIFAAVYKGRLHLRWVPLLLRFADVHQKAGSPATALPYVLSAEATAASLQADLLAAEARVQRAELLLELDAQHAPWALSVLRGCMPLVLGHGGLALQARVHLAAAKALLSAHATTPDGLADVSEEVLGCLGEAADCYGQLEEAGRLAGVEYTRAAVLHALGRTGERDAMAQKFCAAAGVAVGAAA